MLNKEPAATEVYNDINSDVVNYFRVLRDPDMAKELAEALMNTPFSREEYDLAWERYKDPDIGMVERARLTYIKAQMSFSPNGATRDGKPGFSGIKLDGEKCTHKNKSVFLQYHTRIHAFTERLRNTIIEHTDALRVIRQYDNPETLFYVDPPYLDGTWDNGGVYDLENITQDDLLDTLLAVKGMVVLSGYDNDLYNERLKGWAKDSRKTVNQLQQERVECLWISPNCEARKIGMKSLFV